MVRFLLLVLSIGCSLVGLEITVRLLSPLAERTDVSCTDPTFEHCGRNSNMVTRFLAPQEKFFEHYRYAWRLLPHRQAKTVKWRNAEVLYSYRSNSLGFRGDEVNNEKQRKILFLGDSVTFGHELSESATFVRKLQRSIDARAEGVELLNAGTPGNDFAAYVQRIEEILNSIHIDTVVLSIVLNDMRPCCSVRMYNPPLILQRSMAAQAFFQQVSFLLSQYDSAVRYGTTTPAEILNWQIEAEQYLNRHIERGSPIQREFAAYVKTHMWHFGPAWSSSAWARAKDRLLEMKDSAESHGVQLKVLLIPIREQVIDESVDTFPQTQLAKLSESIALDYFNVLPCFRTAWKREQSEDFFTDGLHLSEKGNEVLAQCLLDVVL